MFGALAVFSYIWWAFDAWSNLEFIGQKSGVIWNVLHFLFATALGAKIISGVFAVLFVGSLLFQFERAKPLALPGSSPSPLLTAASASEKTEKPLPNLVDRGIRVFRAHQDIWAQVLVEGASDTRYSTFDPDWQVLTVEICNEFRAEPKVAPVDNLTAEIKYTFPDKSDFKLNRGAWLGARNRIGLAVNDSKHLIIVLSQMKHPAQVRIFTREYPRQEYIHLDPILGDLPHGQDYAVEVALISESKGERYTTLDYMLAIDKDGYIEFVKASDWEAFEDARAAEDEKQQTDV